MICIMSFRYCLKILNTLTEKKYTVKRKEIKKNFFSINLKLALHSRVRLSGGERVKFQAVNRFFEQ